jgi:surface protein
VALIENDNIVKYKQFIPPQPINEIVATYDNWREGSNIVSYIFDITQIDKMYMNGVEITPTHRPDYLNNPVKFVLKNTFNDGSYMFYGCYSLTSLDLSLFNTANVTDMGNMFGSCESLTSLDLSLFDTANVTDMNGMFYYCNSLTSLDVSSFNTAKVTNMENMFYYCRSLTSLDLSSFNTAKVNNMNYMFDGCESLTSLDLSSFDTANVTDMHNMFYGCYSLTSLDVSSFDTAKVTYMHSMFDSCSSLTSLDVSSFDTANVTDMSWMFDGCESLTDLNPFYNWKQGNVNLSYSPITPLAVHQLIERSMNASDGATARTLKLKSTTKSAWESSEYYNQDLALLPVKNITIA